MIFRPLVLIFFLVISQSCAFLGDDLTEMLFREKVYNRNDVMDKLKTGILVNIMHCPNNYYAGLYAIETHLPVVAREPYYTRESVDNCTALLAAFPCSINTQADIIYFTGSYLGVMNICALEKVGL